VGKSVRKYRPSGDQFGSNIGMPLSNGNAILPSREFSLGQKRMPRTFHPKCSALSDELDGLRPCSARLGKQEGCVLSWLEK